MRSILISIQSYLFYSIPFFLLTGPFLPDLFLSMICLIFLYITISERLWQYFKNKFFILFISFYFYLIVSSLLSNNVFFALENSIFYFRFGIFSLATWFLINENKNFIKIFTLSFFIIFIFCLFDGYYQYINDINIFGYDGVETRLTLLLNDKMLLGSYLVRLFPFLIALLLITKLDIKYKILLSIIIFILTDILIFLSGERTAFVLALVFSIFIIIATPNYKLIRLLTLIFSIVLISIITLKNPQVMDRNITQTIEQTQIDELLNEEGSNRGIIFFSPQHHSHIVTSYRMFVERPIFGHGPNSFRLNCHDKKYEYDAMACSTHPHNSYIQIISELGLVGLIPILLVIFHFLLKIYFHLFNYKHNSNRRLSDYEIFLISIFLLTLWPFVPTQNFFNNWINIVYFLPVGFYLHSIYKKKT